MIAREIADYIARRAAKDESKYVWRVVIERHGGLDIAACEAAGLAHDIGHPPFGHAGEDALDHYLVNHDVADGFEGNAQTFRTVTRLDRVKGTSRYGLNLTNVTLAAILKYPYAKHAPFDNPDNRKFGAYREDATEMQATRQAVLGLVGDEPDHELQTLEASVMDLADDIAYAVHDLEDFLAAGLIDVGLVLREIDGSLVDAGIDDVARTTLEFSLADFGSASNELVFVKAASRHRKKYSPLFNDRDYAAALHDVSNFLMQLGDPDQQDYSMNLRLLLKEFVSRFFGAIELSEKPPYAGGPAVSLESEAWHQMQVLKSITRHYLVSRPRMGTMQRAQTRAIATLMDGLAEWVAAAPEEYSVPPTLMALLARSDVSLPVVRTKARKLGPAYYRAFADYACTMSDSEALMRSQWLAGTEVPGSFRLALS